MTVLQIKPCANVALALRNIADRVDAGEYDEQNCTLVIGTDIFQIGTFDDDSAAILAVWNLNYAIHKLMKGANSIED